MGVTVAIDVPLVGDARLKNWAKVVRSINTGQTGGWAYEGEFIATGGIQDVEAPCVVLVYGEHGSRGNPRPEAQVFLANTDGTLSLQATASGRAWARTLRDGVVGLLERDTPSDLLSLPWDPSLMGYTTEALDEELRRRSR
jgi:hypothetical protein